MKKKALALVLSLVLLITICVPGTWATESTEQGATVCQKDEHTHVAECYTQAQDPSCGIETGAGAHKHTEACEEPVRELFCTIPEDENHTHTDEQCYQDKMVLDCHNTEEDHLHTVDCFKAETKIACKRDENPGHQHGDACYEKTLICALEEHTHDGSCYAAPASDELDENETTDETEKSEESEDTEAPVCTCATETEVHAEGCPLYVAPTEETDETEDQKNTEDVTPVCTCATETEVHADTCPLYVAPTDATEPPAGHVTGCDGEGCVKEECTCKCHMTTEPACTCGGETCTTEDCPCPCHQAKDSFYEKLMAANSIEDFESILVQMTEADIAAFSEEQMTAVEARVAQLMLPEEPAAIAEETQDAPVESEVIYCTVDFTNVAPFKAPVTG